MLSKVYHHPVLDKADTIYLEQVVCNMNKFKLKRKEETDIYG